MKSFSKFTSVLFIFILIYSCGKKKKSDQTNLVTVKAQESLLKQEIKLSLEQIDSKNN